MCVFGNVTLTTFFKTLILKTTLTTIGNWQKVLWSFRYYFYTNKYAKNQTIPFILCDFRKVRFVQKN